MIQIKIDKAYRKFKEGDIYNFDVSPSYTLVVVGKNGVGKSSLFRGIRGIKDSLEKINKSNLDGMTASANEIASLEFNSSASITGLEEFDEIYCLDRVTDDPTTFEAASTAYGLIAGGGFYTQKMSGGQKSIFMLRTFVDKIKKVHKQGASSLVILDEADTGFDMNNQMMYITAATNMLKKVLENPNIIVVTHNPLSIISKMNKVPIKVYDIDPGLCKTFDSPEDWCFVKTGIKIEN